MRRLFRQPSAQREPLPPTFPSTVWWAQSMRDAVAVRWESLAASSPHHPLILHSGCAGLGPDRMVCKALGIPIGGGTASEMKAQCQEFLVMNSQLAADHVVDNLSEHTKPHGFCRRHGKICEIYNRGNTVDMLVVGPPCQPFTTFRHDVEKEGPQKHPLYSVAMGGGDDPHDNVISLAIALQPRVMVVEQVEGFARPFGPGASPLELLCSKMLNIRDQAGDQLFVGAKVFSLDSNTWIEMNRPRLFAGAVEQTQPRIEQFGRKHKLDRSWFGLWFAVKAM